jgi:hypothetical protein
MYFRERDFLPCRRVRFDVDGPLNKLQWASQAFSPEATMSKRVRQCIVLSLGFLVFHCALAQRPQDCAGNASATAALEKWQSVKSVHLSSAARTQVLAGFCAAVDAVKTARQADPIPSSRFESVAASTIEDYLDRVSRTDMKPRTLAATLDEKLGFAALSRQVVSPYGRLSVQYPHPVEYVRINGERHLPYPDYLILAGPTTVEGVAHAATVCRFQLSIAPSTTSSISC